MLTIYGVTKGHLEERQHIAPRSLVRLTNPEDWEIDYVRKTCGGIDGNDLRAAMDDEEPSRFEENGAYTLLVVDVPVPELHGKTQAYRTYPLAIITTAKSSVITTSRIDFAALDSSGIDPRKVTVIDGKTRFVYDLLMHMATAYQRYLRDIESRRARLVEGLDHTSRRTRVSDLVTLHSLETDIVYLETSLSGNRAILERAARSPRILADKTDETLFDDVLIEIRQADEMARTYRQLITSTRELFSSVMDNGLNTTMKLLAAITIVLAIPTMIAGFYGMNVDSAGMPFADSPFGFLIVIVLSLVLCIIAVRILRNRNLL